MHYCSNCGASISGKGKYCPSCGQVLDFTEKDDTVNIAVEETAVTTVTKDETSGTKEAQKDIFQTLDRTSEFTRGDIEANKGMAILCYLGFLVLIPLLIDRPSPFLRFHTQQGMNIFVAAIVGTVLSWIGFFSGIGIIYMLMRICGVGILVLEIIGIYNAYNGKAKELPLVGGIHLIH